MKLIQILPNTIRKNPKAGRTSFKVAGRQTISFEYIGNALPGMVADVDYIVMEWNDEIIRGELIDFTKVDALLEIKGITVTVDKNIQTVHHLPEPQWLYEYENPELACENCNSDVKLRDIEFDSDGDDTFRVCPICRGINTFEAVEFESIQRALESQNK